ncbi:hypothetical protein KAX02_05445 [candidate division WOR-3 bacterium]|nr:hypothetical protein [candidate division WOR-3 bacterium]
MELTKSRTEKLLMLRNNPDLFSEKVLGNKLWSKEREMLQAIGKYNKVAIGSGHKIGKTFTLADIVIWYLTCFPQSKVVTTAPTGRQVKDLLWSEITTKYNKVKHLIGGRCISLRIEIDTDQFAVGFKSEDYDPNAFQGYHSQSGHTCVIFDEACGVPKAIWDAAAGIADKWIVAGNRLNALTDFERCFTQPSWKSIVISSLESPNLTGECYIPGLATEVDIQNWKERYIEDSPLYNAHVKGECPHEGLDTLIPLYMLERIEKLKEKIKPEPPFYGGLDVAASGADISVMQILDSKGQHIDRIAWSKKTTTETEGRAKKIIRERHLKGVVVDADGLGLGVYQELADTFQNTVIPYHGSGSSNSDAYHNRRTEIWNWVQRDLENGGLSAIQDIGYLFADLSGIKQGINTKGELQLEEKKIYKKRLGHSPDDGDAFVMANMARKYGTVNYENKTEIKEDKLPEQFTLAEFASDLGDFK